MPAKRRRPIAPSELVILSLVVGTLAMMLFPVFARARDRARQAVCFANMRTIVQAIRMYLADNDDRFPPRENDPDVLAYFSGYPGGGGKDQWDPEQPGSEPYCHRAYQANPYLRWPVILDRYLPDRRVWRCPSARLEGGASFINGGGPDWVAHLRAHEGEWGHHTDPHLCPILSWPMGWGGEVTDSLTESRIAVPRAGRGRVSSPGMFLQSIGVNGAASAEPSALAIDDPAWYVICADGGATIDAFCTGTLAYPDLCHLECAGPGDWEADWEQCPWSRHCGATAAMKLDPKLREPFARHCGGVNIGFLDGHVRWFHSEEVIALSPSHGNPNRGRLRGYGPWGPTKDASWYDAADGIPALY